ncbi:hypothetical protein KR018_003834 [Drosophila ironensis]|nr:hypothetical protein KR018_003834 [Drosophila ironensis]
MQELKRKPLHEESPRRTPGFEDPQYEETFEEGTSSEAEQELRDEEDGTPAKVPPRSPLRTRSPHRLHQSPPKYRNESSHTPRPGKEEESPPQSYSWKLLLIGFLVPMLLSMVYRNAFSSEARKTCSFEGLRGKQPSQTAGVWNALQSGIEGLINQEHKQPSVFLFLHEDKSLEKLILDIVSEASSCFGGSGQLIHMGKKDFETGENGYGFAVEQFKAKVKNGGKVFLIVNLNEISPSGARALHSICDVYSPLAEDAVIFLTLRVSNNSGSKNSVQLATDTLYDLWSQELQDNELDPLITRVTDQVLHLKT